MALKPCRECGAEVSTSAKSCPSCGVSSPARKPLGLGALLLVFILGAVALNMFGDDPGASERTRDRATDLRFYGVIACENAVRQALVSPSTAEFQGGTGHGVVLADSIVRVRSWVDSQNRMGATVRTQFTCEAVNSGSNVTTDWRIAELEMDG